MHTRKLSTFLLASAISGYAFARPEIDPLRVPDCDRSESSTLCGIRSLLYAPDDGNGGGGGGADDKKFSQADLDKAIGDRLGKLKAEKADLEARFTAQKTEFDAIKAQFGELSGAAEKAREEAELKGKSELEKLQIQFDKAQKKLAETETARQADLAKLTKDLEGERGGRIEDAKRNWATQVLASGAADGMSQYAIQALLSEGEFEIDENRQIKKVTFEGAVLEKPADVSTAFYKARPGFAKPAQGGSNQPRGNGAGGQGNGMDQATSIEGLLGAGLAARSPGA